MQVAELYRGHAGFDVHALVAELVEAESVPFLPVLRYKASGLRKREIWERTWELQRREDAIDADGGRHPDPSGSTRAPSNSKPVWQPNNAAANRKKSATSHHRRSTPPPISRSPPAGGCAARSTCPRSASSATHSVPVTPTRRW